MKKRLKNRFMHDMKIKIQTRRNVLNLSTVMMICLMVLALGACTSGDTAHDHTDLYTCPMHPTVNSDKPGICPVCAMELVRKGRSGEEVKITEDLARLIKSTNEVVLSSVKTVKGEYKSMPVVLYMHGVVTYDTRKSYTIPARVGGRLEKVLLKYNYQPVRKGQLVAEIYSPELVSAQREYVYLLKNDGGNELLLEAARSKLLLLGVTQNQIQQLTTSQEVTYTFSIYSPYAGFVISENQSTPAVPLTANATPGTTGGMGMGGGNTVSSSSVPTSTTSSMVREGSYVSTGQTLFRIVNVSSLWIEFNLPTDQAAKIKVGNLLTWKDRHEIRQSKIDLVEPFFVEGEDFIRVRSYYKGSDVSIGQLVEATMESVSSESLWIPRQALLDLGVDKIVFVKGRGMFTPKKVTAGLQSEEWIEIVSGLNSTDEVAINAQYLIDSENFIKTSN